MEERAEESYNHSGRYDEQEYHQQGLCQIFPADPEDSEKSSWWI